MAYRVSALATMLVVGCGTDGTTASLPYPESIDASPPTTAPLMPSAADGGSAAERDAVAFRVTWCVEDGRDPGLRLETLAYVAQGYERDRTSDCRTRGLLPELDALQRRNWLDYLIGYSLLMLGCPPRSTPVPGGILAFGPANTSVIGRPSPRLGRDDVERLADHYMNNLIALVPLSSVELSVVATQLRKSGELAVDASLSDVLSECMRDAGL